MSAEVADSMWTTSVSMFDRASLTVLMATCTYMVATCIMSLAHLHDHLDTFYLSQLETEDGRRNAKENGTRLLTVDEQANVQHAYNMNVAGAVIGLVLLCACLASQGTLLFKALRQPQPPTAHAYYPDQI